MQLPTPLLETARAAYLRPPRAYHAWSHVEDVLRRYEEVARGPGWRHPTEVLLAVVFHDAVYVAGDPDNEAKSADLAATVIPAHLPSADVDRVRDLILLTASHGKLTAPDFDAEAALFLDCDMAILGAAPEIFDRYDAAIREEYAAIPTELYVQGRRQFLTRVLAAPQIFFSDFFHDRLDDAARANLTRVLGPP